MIEIYLDSLFRQITSPANLRLIKEIIHSAVSGERLVLSIHDVGNLKYIHRIIEKIESGSEKSLFDPPSLAFRMFARSVEDMQEPIGSCKHLAANPRCVSIALTHLETAAMFINKAAFPSRNKPKRGTVTVEEMGGNPCAD